MNNGDPLFSHPPCAHSAPVVTLLSTTEISSITAKIERKLTMDAVFHSWLRLCHKIYLLILSLSWPWELWLGILVGCGT